MPSTPLKIDYIRVKYINTYNTIANPIALNTQTKVLGSSTGLTYLKSV